MEQEDKSDRWRFENYICVEKPELWVNEAINLRYSAIVLNEYTWNLHKVIFDKEKPALDLPAFWTPRIERMLWGYAFENLFKAIIIINLKMKAGIREVPFEEIKSHDLIQLAKKADVILAEDEVFYLNIAQKCVIWAGRYPIPTKLHHLPLTRKTMKSREDLIKRSEKQFELLMQGMIKRVESEGDIIHSGVGTIELDTLTRLFDRSNQIFNDIKGMSHNKT